MNIGEALGNAAGAGITGLVAGGPIGALVGIATSLVPALVRDLVGDKAAETAQEVANAVTAVTGTSDATEAAAILAESPEKMIELRRQILDLQVRLEANRQQHEVEMTKASDADRQGSREAMIRLAGADSRLAWMPAFQTIVVGVAFIGSLVALFLMVFLNVGDIRSGMREVLLMILGILAGEFRGACQFWIGGSRIGSLAGQANIVQNTATQALSTETQPLRRGSLFSRNPRS